MQLRCFWVNEVSNVPNHRLRVMLLVFTHVVTKRLALMVVETSKFSANLR